MNKVKVKPPKKQAKQLKDVKEVKVSIKGPGPSIPPAYPCHEKSKLNWAVITYLGVFVIIVAGLIHWAIKAATNLEKAEQGQQVEITLPLREVN